MAIEIFNRYENKYRLDSGMFTAVKNEIAARMETDNFNPTGEAYTVFNIYYDTPNNDLIRTSISKPIYKEKLRLRSYGTPNKNSMVYVEIKKNVRGIVNKRRSRLTLNEAYQFLSSGVIPERKPYMNEQVLNEIAYILRLKPLSPALFIYYERLAYFGERGLRVSFDTNIQTRRYDLLLENSAYGEPLLGVNEWLMEIKTHNNLPLWLSGLLAGNQAYPASFSKYGEEYKQTLAGITATENNSFFIFAPANIFKTNGTAAVRAGAHA